MPAPAKQSRRSFIVASLAATVGFPCIVPSTVFGQTAPSNRINIGFIGTGRMGTGHVSRSVVRDDMQILAVCDVDESHRLNAKNVVEKQYAAISHSGSYSGCDAYNDFRDVIRRPDIDAIVNVTPYHWHSVINITAANAGKHIFGEKPVAHFIPEGRATVEAVKRNGIIFQTGTQQRSQEQFRIACELVLNGAIGELKTVHCRLVSRHAVKELYKTLSEEEQKRIERTYYTANPADGVFNDITGIPQPEMPIPEGFDYDMWLGPLPYAPYTEKRCHYSFRFISDIGAGRLADWAPHHCDTAHWGMGMAHTGPLMIKGEGVYPRDGLWDTVITYKCELTYANGVTMLVYDVAQPDCGVLFEGTEGWVRVRREAGLDSNPTNLVTKAFGSNDIHLYRSLDHFGNFLDCIRSGKEPVSPVEDGHRASSIAQLCDITMRLKRPMKWNPDTERFIGDEEANRMLSYAFRSPWEA